jgi:hypothetical protein
MDSGRLVNSLRLVACAPGALVPIGSPPPAGAGDRELRVRASWFEAETASRAASAEGVVVPG